MDIIIRKKIQRGMGFRIKKYIELQDKYICLFNIWNKWIWGLSNYTITHNVVAFSKQGDYWWVIDEQKEAYSNILLDKNGKVWCFNHDGESFLIDIETGKILRHKYMDKKVEEKILKVLGADILGYYETEGIYICIFHPSTEGLPLDKSKLKYFRKISFDERMRNVVAFDKNGNQLWRIQDIREIENYHEKWREIGYEKIKLDDDWNIWTYDTLGEAYHLDPKTGAILEHKYMKKDLLEIIEGKIELKIRKYVGVEGVYVCLFHTTDGWKIEKNMRNIAAFDKKGNQLWRIEDIRVSDNIPAEGGAVFLNVYLDAGGNLWCWNAIGENHRMDPKTGKILEHVFAK